ncbi:MAG: M23 family metallopeptidase [Ferruginibacter sp.]
MKNILPILFSGTLVIITSSYTTKDSPAEIAKQLIYPVTGTKSNVGSVWGDERDGGKRKHEGIDIFAAKGTAVVAISDGVIDLVGNDDIGGNNITLQPHDYEWNAYYAHLDKVYVTAGQQVKKGQLIGTVGNTGNAKTTPPHLHFGIYTTNGAIDPLPYVKTAPRLTGPVTVSPEETARNKPAPSSPTGTIGKRTTPARRRTDSPTGSIVKNAALQVLTGFLNKKIRF